MLSSSWELLFVARALKNSSLSLACKIWSSGSSSTLNTFRIRLREQLKAIKVTAFDECSTSPLFRLCKTHIPPSPGSSSSANISPRDARLSCLMGISFAYFSSFEKWNSIFFLLRCAEKFPHCLFFVCLCTRADERRKKLLRFFCARRERNEMRF
jgi:hypothetical protein